MTTILFQLLIEPIKLLLEVIYFYAYKLTGNCGWSIVALSLVVNLLVLPLYNRADELQLLSRQKENMIRPMADHIKKSFTGDERVFMLQTYYRDMKYSPLNTLKSSISLILQIPFFMAAYYFLTELQMLHGISLGPIEDLGLPDGLIKIGTLSINLLPILMTLINIVSSFIYSEKGNVKDKIKLVLIALVFLVLLYGSPSGLVFYWTLNNVFSLVKNIVLKFKKPGKKKDRVTDPKVQKEFDVLIILSGILLALLAGLMIPADVIAQNPAELINTYSSTPHTPALYLLSSSLIAVGTFVLWIPLFYYLTRESFGKYLAGILCAWSLNAVTNYVLFNRNFGLLNRKLIYEYIMDFATKETVLNIMANTALTAAVILFAIKFRKTLRNIILIAIFSIALLSGSNTILIFNILAAQNYDFNAKPQEVSVPLTRTGKNVIVIMMDRMIGAYLPYIFNERPEFEESFDGFTYYPNTISFGTHTNFGAPALYGGYDYTPDRMNARSDELLVDKHNEALHVMPVLFADNGWNVSVGDPSYANYEWIPDVSIYDDNENINAFRLSGMFNDRSDLLENAGDELEIRLNRNFFCYGLMKTLPYPIQPLVYSDGSYNYMNFSYPGYVDDTFMGVSLHIQNGLYESFIEEYTAMQALNDIVEVTDDPTNCFFMFSNCTAHEICLLQEPDYVPAVMTDNIEYDALHEDRFTVNGETMRMDTDWLNYSHYECNMAAYITLANWFDYLRANGLYDNTRIIIVADHGCGMEQFDSLMVADPYFDAEWVNPLLMIKDFGEEGFSTSYDFMTNADTPYIATNGLIENPVNPYTGNPLRLCDSNEDQLIYISEEWNVNYNNGTQYEDPEGYWLTVRENIWDDENWAYAGGAER